MFLPLVAVAQCGHRRFGSRVLGTGDNVHYSLDDQHIVQLTVLTWRASEQAVELAALLVRPGFSRGVPVTWACSSPKDSAAKSRAFRPRLSRISGRCSSVAKAVVAFARCSGVLGPTQTGSIAAP